MKKAPNTKVQASGKLQAPTFKSAALVASGLWLPWCLEFEAWSFSLLEVNPVKPARRRRVGIGFGHDAAVADHAGQYGRPIRGANRVIVFHHVVRAVHGRERKGHRWACLGDASDTDGRLAVGRDDAVVGDAAADGAATCNDSVARYHQAIGEGVYPPLQLQGCRFDAVAHNKRDAIRYRHVLGLEGAGVEHELPCFVGEKQVFNRNAATAQGATAAGNAQITRAGAATNSQAATSDGHLARGN